MKSHTAYLKIKTKKEKEIINISDKVKKIVSESEVMEGLCLVNSMHITSSVFINDEEEGLKEDFMEWLEKLAPVANYKHHKTGEKNGDAHLKTRFWSMGTDFLWRV
jgi:secondary thiamine-phosphate synthase enzyme